MNKIRLIFLALLVIGSTVTYAQKRVTVSGIIKDKTTGETLIGAAVYLKETPSVATLTNGYGFYSLNLPQGSHTLVFSFMGYSPQYIAVDGSKDQLIDISLSEDVKQLEEITVTANQATENLIKPQMGMEKLSVAQIAKIPVIFGEKDVIKTLQLLPGVKTESEGSSGFTVRGGSTDGNLVLLDEAPVYNASHLLGFFSVFNSDAIKDVTLYKGTQPAQYGGRLSSVLDIRMNDGNANKFGVSGGIGLIASRIMVEGPVKKEKGSFMISGRRTYADLFLKLSNDPQYNQTQLYFYDFNAKFNYAFDSKNKLYISGYFGKDVLGFSNTFGLNWGNGTATARFNHIFNPRFFSNTIFVFSNYDYKFKLRFSGEDIGVLSRIQDLNFKEDLQFFPNSVNSFKFGVNSVLHKIIPGDVSVENNTSSSQSELTNKRGWENAAYASHLLKPTDNFNIEYGIRFNLFTVLGGGAFYTYDKAGKVTSTTFYDKNEVVKNYFMVEPRLNMSYVFNNHSSVKMGYARNSQNIHVVSNSTSGNPTDVYLPSSNNVMPQFSDQISAGYFKNLFNDGYETSVEVYYKKMANQLDYRDGSDIMFNEFLEGELLTGKGRAYGVELLFRKNVGALTGWVSYTLSRSERVIDGVNKNKWYPARQDRTHDVAVVAMYTLNERWSFSGTWVYYTGNAVTFPSGKYAYNNQVVNYYSERNGYRMPAYHRMDVGATWLRKKTAKFESSWTFSIYNLYGRENAYTITFQPDPDDPTRTQAIKTSLFKFVPSVTYNFKF